MKIREIREMAQEQLLETLASLYRREAVARMKMGTDGLKNTAELGKFKKTIARILTVLNERNGSVVS